MTATSPSSEHAACMIPFTGISSRPSLVTSPEYSLVHFHRFGSPVCQAFPRPFFLNRYRHVLHPPLRESFVTESRRRQPLFLLNFPLVEPGGKSSGSHRRGHSVPTWVFSPPDSQCPFRLFFFGVFPRQHSHCVMLVEETSNHFGVPFQVLSCFCSPPHAGPPKKRHDLFHCTLFTLPLIWHHLAPITISQILIFDAIPARFSPDSCDCWHVTFLVSVHLWLPLGSVFL